MKSLPANLTLQKNKVNQTDPWLFLLDIVLIDPNDSNNTEEFFLVQNNENITYNGQTYTATNFEISPTKSCSEGEILVVKLSVSNVTMALQSYLEAYNGGMESTIKLTVVNNAYLGEDYTELEMDFIVLSCSADDTYIVFSLGAPNPLLAKFPQLRYLALHCSWAFRSVECEYGEGSGETDTTCERTLEACQAKNNTLRFGGCPGMKSGGIIIA